MNETAYDEARKENMTVTMTMFEKHAEVVCHTLQSNNIRARNKSSCSSLLLKFQSQILWNACCSGDLATVREYVDKVDLNWKNPDYVRFCKLNAAKQIFIIGILQGCTMLHIAVEYHHEKIVLELLKKGARTEILSEVNKYIMHTPFEY